VEGRRREAQLVSLGAVFVFMLTIGIGPLVVLGHRGPWVGDAWMLPAGLVVVGAFSLAVLVRAQKLRSGESILSGRFGLVIAVVALAVLLGVGGLFVAAIADGQADRTPARVRFGGPIAVGLGIAYLVRRIHANLTGRDVAPAVEPVDDEGGEEDDPSDDS
jgi:hypothetical protein